MAYKFSKGKRGFGDITFEDDSDTGIDFEPDTVKIETGGSERVVVSNSNIQSNEPIKIRAGSTSGAPLDIQWHGMDGTPGGSENAVNISHKRVTNSTRNTNIAFTKWYNNGSSDTSLVFGSIGAVATGTWDNNASSRVGHINFKLVSPSDSGVLTERMRITTDGKVGIGTGSPEHTLHVAGDIGIDQYIRHNGDSNTNINFTDDKINLKAGNLSMITMEEKDSAPHEVRINNGGNNIDFIVEDNSGNVYFTADASTARIGIGDATAPSSHLHIKDTGDVVITLEADSDNADENDNAYIEFKQDAANTRGIVGTCGSTNKGPDGTTFTGAIANSLLIGTHYATFNGSHYDTPMQLACEGAVQITISDNHVGVGTNTPSHKLDVNGDIRVRGNDIRDNSGNPAISFDGSSNTTIVNNLTVQDYTFPSSDGSANQVLQTNGSGQLSFANAGGGGDIAENVITGSSSLSIASSNNRDTILITPLSGHVTYTLPNPEANFKIKFLLVSNSIDYNIIFKANQSSHKIFGLIHRVSHTGDSDTGYDMSPASYNGSAVSTWLGGASESPKNTITLDNALQGSDIDFYSDGAYWYVRGTVVATTGGASSSATITFSSGSY